MFGDFCIFVVMEKETWTLKELEDKLTEKERRFCHEYIIDWNKARAARVAGYSEENARQIGYDTFTKLYIQQYIEFIKNDLEKEAGISKLMAIREWKKIAFGNITDMFDIQGDNVKVKDGINLSELPREITDLISEVQNTKDGIKVKLYCKDNALDKLSKLMGWDAPTKTDHTTKGESLNDVSNQSTEDLIKRAEAIKTINDAKS